MYGNMLTHVPLFVIGRAQPVIPPNLYHVYEHKSLGSPGKCSLAYPEIHLQICPSWHHETLSQALSDAVGSEQICM